jgi:hypothetical protein
VFREGADERTRERIDQLKQAVGLAPDRWKFHVTTRTIRAGPDEVTLRVRSVLEIMGFLSRGVQVPQEHADAGYVTTIETAAIEWAVPLRVECQAEAPPRDALVAVQHDDFWYFIRRSDHRSKQVFGLLSYLYQMQAPQAQGLGPLLTVPTG